MSGATSRRALLAQAGVVAGIAGASAYGIRSASGAETNRLRALPRVVHGRDWRVMFAGTAPGQVPAAGDSRLPHGTLVDADGVRLGLLESSLLPSTGQASHLHRIDLGDGGLIGMGPGTLDDATFVIVGGTGRYAGASGTYRAEQRPRETGGDGTATFTFDILTPEA